MNKEEIKEFKDWVKDEITNLEEFKDWVKDEITNLEEKLSNELVTPEDYEDQTSSLNNILDELEFLEKNYAN